MYTGTCIWIFIILILYQIEKTFVSASIKEAEIFWFSAKRTVATSNGTLSSNKLCLREIMPPPPFMGSYIKFKVNWKCLTHLTLSWPLTLSPLSPTSTVVYFEGTDFLTVWIIRNKMRLVCHLVIKSSDILWHFQVFYPNKHSTFHKVHMCVM